MGGNIFNTERIPRNKYYYLAGIFATKICDLLDQHTSDYKFKLFKSYEEKETFGDIDFAVTSNVKEILKKELLSFDLEMSINGHTLSLLWEGYQVDIRFISERWFDTALNFFNYNDLGNLVGKLARYHHLKYGWKGLWVKILSDDNSRIIGEYPISEDLEKIHKFLKLDYDNQYGKFKTEEDIFRYVSSVPYFNESIFTSNLRSDQRHRDSKRPMFQRFLEYLKNVEDLSNVRPDKLQVLFDAELFFNVKLFDLIELDKSKYKKRQAVAEKFNGRLIMERYNIKGAALGAAINSFKKSFPSVESYQDFILTHDTTEIFKKFHHINERLVLNEASY